jgi:WD40 repeat protein
VSSGERLFSAEGAGLTYSADGRWLATRGADGTTVVLLDAKTHQVAARLSGHEAMIHSAAFSPDSRRLATCSKDGTIRLWEIGSGACQVLRGHTDEVFAVAFHPGGTRLASAGRDGAVWLWDLAKGEPVVRLQGHTSYIWSLAFSPDGKTLVSGSGDGTVRLWDTAPLAVRYQARRDAEKLRPWAEQLVKRLFREKKDAEAVVAALRADASLSEPQRHAAFRAVLRRQAP